MEDLRKNKITIRGEEFFYRLQSEVSEFSESEWTEFYKEIKIKTRKKYFLFGPIVEIEEPIILFKVYFWITSERYTKDELRAKLEKKVELLHRKKEIEKGELI